MYKLSFRAAMVFLMLATTACATRSTVVLRHDLSSRAVCCATFADMKFVPLTTDEADLSIGSGSPIFAFDEGKSYFAAYSLPAGGSVPGLVFRSYLTTTFLPDTSVFMPSFMFLDASKKKISVARDVPMRKGGGNFWLGPYYSGEVTIPKGAAFVVVFTVDGPRQPLSATSENGAVWPVPASLSGVLKIAVSR